MALTMALRAAGWLCLVVAASWMTPAGRAAREDRLGLLPEGMSPDAAAFSENELYVLHRGTITVFSLPDVTRRRAFGGSGRGPGKLSPRHQFDQGLRLAAGRVLVEDNDKLVSYSQAGRLIGEARKPQNTTWFLPIGDRFVAKSMIVTGRPPTQIIRAALYDASLHEIAELYRQPWFQQPAPNGFTTELPGDLLHYAVVGNRIWIDASPRGFVIEVFDQTGARVSTIARPYTPLRLTPEERARQLRAVRQEKRVAEMVAQTGSWEQLRTIWRFRFPDSVPAIRELQAWGQGAQVRTFERRDGLVRYVMLDAGGGNARDRWLPEPTDAETEARVAGTSFFGFVGDWYYYLRLDSISHRWEVRRTRL